MLAAVPGLALALAGCGGGADNGNASAVATGGGAVTAGKSDDAIAGAKISAYTEGYNKLIGTFGLSETANSYFEEAIAGKSPSDSVSITDGWIDGALTKLKEARKLPGGTAALDGAADALIASLDKVMARLAPLNTYYASKAYKDDGLKRGKAEDAAMTAEFKAALAEADRFDTVLTAARRARLAGELRRLKAAGDTLGYNTKIELRDAEDLLGIFNSPDAVRNAAPYAKADQLVAGLEKTLAEQRTAYAAAKAKAGPSEQPDYGHSSVVDSLTSMIGDYRDMRQSKDPKDLNDVIKEYNRAIESANNIH